MNEQERRLITLLPRDIKLFLSSTFENLHNERQILKNEVFSVLAAKYRNLGINVTVTDLRWGITNELDQTEDTISICLKEVERAQPYFVGLLGGRYGWVPERKHINENTAFYEQYKELLDNYLSQKISMTEIEIRFGVLERDKVEQIRGKPFNKQLVTRFYFGDGAVYNDYENSQAKDKQTTLKNEIKRLGFYAGNFENVETLKALVAQDLEAQIDRDILVDLRQEGFDIESFKAIQLTEEQQHYLEYYAFEKYKTQHYIKRLADEQIENLLKYKNKKNKPILVHGKSGTGKSAMMSYLAMQLSLNSGKRPYEIIRCYIGTTKNISTSETMVKYIATEINRISGLEDPINLNQENSRSFLSPWIYKLKKPTLILIDGINQLEIEALENGLMYLPLILPEQVHLLVSSTTIYHETKKIDLSRYEVVEVPAFIAEEKERYIQAFLLNHGKKLDSVIKDFLVHKTNDFQSNPLYLNLVLKEVVLSGLQTSRLEHGVEDKGILRQEEEREIRTQLERMDIDTPFKVQYIVQLLKYYSDSNDFIALFKRLIRVPSNIFRKLNNAV